MRAAAELGRDEQPELYLHVHPHGRATASLARSFAAALQTRGLPLDEIALGAYLHDFGKYLLPKSLLLKPGPLTEDERALVTLHPVYGSQVLSGLSGLTEAVCQVVLYHHERWDGTGYPEGLQGTRIPLTVRLITIADVYASLRARRSYKPTLTKRQATAEMELMAGRELDPALTADFLKFVRL
ncbi:MAG TPA: HD domain-containing phosphohydrolase [Pyrinomonadaceae bacterium]|nr:HD domain-containing phosphohydrolase [Pyrinomonadaceae bacterium]